MTLRILPFSLLAAALLTSAAPAADGGISAFGFDTLASRNAGFDRATYVYPADNDLAGQINANTGDVRLDGVVIDGHVFAPSELQLAIGANIVKDDAVDTKRGGGNLTAGFGIGADRDPLLDEGIGSTTPTADDIRRAQANLNLSSLVAIRENVGTASYEISFERPTDTLLLWERGNSGDVQVEAIDDAGNVIGSLLVLDGANDGMPRAPIRRQACS